MGLVMDEEPVVVVVPLGGMGARSSSWSWRRIWRRKETRMESRREWKCEAWCLKVESWVGRAGGAGAEAGVGAGAVVEPLVGRREVGVVRVLMASPAERRSAEMFC